MSDEKRGGIKCPECGQCDSSVIDSRGNTDENSIRRRRKCVHCGTRFTTREITHKSGADFVLVPAAEWAAIVEAVACIEWINRSAKWTRVPTTRRRAIAEQVVLGGPIEIDTRTT